ncbi:hypothetical protein LCGC14_0442120 [marine sediment metagenome]|uniref:Uncharacterized protein n=1 Tax=marine sediment metagenome TaxID=412755 RepID=A0A0F9T3H0_9ZZZZ
MKCTCKDWKENQPVIDGALTMQHIRGYGGEIKKVFTYCPWCGEKIK